MVLDPSEIEFLEKALTNEDLIVNDIDLYPVTRSFLKVSRNKKPAFRRVKGGRWYAEDQNY